MNVSCCFSIDSCVPNNNFHTVQLTMDASNNSSGGKIKNYVEKSVEAAIGRVRLFCNRTSYLVFFIDSQLKLILLLGCTYHS